MSNPQRYTVGWICAIATEYIAARAFLDEKHEPPDAVAQRDDNNYTLGKIGPHHVVIAVLPSGEYGLVSASTVARDMLHSFPNVRIGLMVGIGGGVPSPRHDIRLGDIVVGDRQGDQSGVFQYDLGKNVQSQDVFFQHTSFMNQAPKVLRSAISGLKALYSMEGHQLLQSVNRVLEKYPRLAEKFSRPPTESDKLYPPTLVHPDAAGGCEALCGIDLADLMTRRKRGKNEDDPAIYYGLIASGNQLMKNAMDRDRLGAEKDVLCFEMEAAGLMNHFPCVVIRGICDYSDSHKNDEWQGFAAMMAAAYASDLLRQVPVTKVEAEDCLIDVLRRVKGGIKWIGQDVDTIKTIVVDEKNARQRDRIKGWLSPSDPTSNLNQGLARRHGQTGSWFLESDALTQWKTGERQHLWLHGLTGSGKTVLSATLVKHLEDETSDDQPLLRFFFDFSDVWKKTLDSLLKSLVWQLFETGGDEAGHLNKLFESNGHGSTQNGDLTTSLWKCLVSMARDIGRINIIIDALDECTTREELLSWIGRLAARPNVADFHLIITGRPEFGFDSSIPPIFGGENCRALDQEAVDKDILAYVDGRLAHVRELVTEQISPDVVEKIRDKVGRQAKGMFRWATCQMDAIAECCDSDALIEDTLKNLPKDLNETYRRILENIRPEGVRILQFLVYAKRRLTISAANEILAARIEKQPSRWRIDKKAIIYKGRLSALCSSLISITTVSQRQSLSRLEEEVGRVHLAHFSVKEYLQDQSDFKIETASIPLTKICLTYLRGMWTSGTEKDLAHFPLKRQAAQILTDVSRFAETCEDVLEGLESLLKIRDAVTYLDNVAFPVKDYSKASALYFACHAGLYNVVGSLIEKGVDVNVRGSPNERPLCAAAASGHAHIVKLLLENEAEVNADSESGDTALQEASSRGHKAVVEVLLDNGAEVNAGNSLEGNALSRATYNGHVGVVELLLDRGAGSMFSNTATRRQFVGASNLSNEEKVNVARPILQMGINAAAAKGEAEELRELLFRTGEIKLWKDWHEEAILIASKNGHQGIVRNLQDERLYHAAEDGEYDIAKALLDAGASPDGRNACFDTALEAAGTGGHLEIVKLLLSRGASVSNGCSGRSSLVSFFEQCRWFNNQEILGLLRQHEVREMESRWNRTS